MADYTLFKNARLFDGDGDTSVPESWVLIKDNRISAVGVGNAVAPQGARVVDVAGQTVMPGLIDTHVHTPFDGR